MSGLVARPAITPLRGAQRVCPDGTTCTAGAPLTVTLALAGCSRWRARLKVDVACTLSAKFKRPGKAGVAYILNNPAPVSVSPATETLMDELAHMGEEAVDLILTPASGTATIAYFDFSRV